MGIPMDCWSASLAKPVNSGLSKSPCPKLRSGKGNNTVGHKDGRWDCSTPLALREMQISVTVRRSHMLMRRSEISTGDATVW